MRRYVMDPPTRAETLAALKVLRGVWVLAPGACGAAGAAGAVEALLRTLVVGVPPPPPDTPSDLMARALEAARQEWELARQEGREVEGRGKAPETDSAETQKEGAAKREQYRRDRFRNRHENDNGGSGGDERRQPPIRISFPKGHGEDGKSPPAMTIAWDSDDVEADLGQPEVEKVRCEALEAGAYTRPHFSPT